MRPIALNSPIHAGGALMPSLGNWDRPEMSQPDNTLLALQTRVSETEQREQAREDRFRTWQLRWIDTKANLIRRLDVVDEQLARLADGDRTSPRLTIVGDEFFEER
jgi:hypothetical protein